MRRLEMLNKILVGKPERWTSFEIHRRRWEDNINIRKIGCGVMGWIRLAQDRVQ
jgi:hypothetical protein